MDAVKSDLYWIHWIVPVGLKVQRAFETASSVFLVSLSVELSDRDEMWFEKDMVKDDRARMCFSKHFYYALCMPWAAA